MHPTVAVSDGDVQRPGAASAAGERGVRGADGLGVLPGSGVRGAGVLRVEPVHGGSEGPGAADDLEAWLPAAEAGVGDDFEVQCEAGQVEPADDDAAERRSFVNEETGWWDKTFHKDLSRWARVPREREAMHFLIVGDSDAGKSAAIRQLLSQIWKRGEAAIVHDPAMEYLPQFYNAARGHVILNPMDARCPFWSPGDKVPHEAEALTLAASLFPDQGRENRFVVEAPRKIFAHLLNLKPTPRELTYWMSNAEEIDRRVEGTELAAMIDMGAAKYGRAFWGR